MSNAEKGAYITLLCHAWADGSIPDDVAKIARLVGEPLRVAKKMWEAIAPCWILAPEAGRLINARMENVRAEQAAYRERQAEKGRRGADARWSPPDSTGIAQALPAPLPEHWPEDGTPYSVLRTPQDNAPDGALAEERAKPRRIRPNPPDVDFGNLEPDVLRVIANDADERKDGLLAESVIRGLRDRLAKARDLYGIDALKHGLAVAIAGGKPTAYAAGTAAKYKPGEGGVRALRAVPNERKRMWWIVDESAPYGYRLAYGYDAEMSGSRSDLAPRSIPADVAEQMLAAYRAELAAQGVA